MERNLGASRDPAVAVLQVLETAVYSRVRFHEWKSIALPFPCSEWKRRIDESVARMQAAERKTVSIEDILSTMSSPL